LHFHAPRIVFQKSKLNVELPAVLHHDWNQTRSLRNHGAPRLLINENGLARRGLLIRHLVMPGMLDETRSILEWIAAELGTNTYINLMDQYHPAGKVSAVQYHEINRRTPSSEFLEAKRIAWSLGLHRLDDGK